MPSYEELKAQLKSQFPQLDAEIASAKSMYEQSMAPLREPVAIPMKEQLATSIAAALPMLIGGLSGGTIGAGQGAQGTLLGMGQAVRSWEEDKERMARARALEAQKAAQLYMNALERAQRNQTAVARGEQQIGLHELGQEAADQRTMMNIAATNSRFNAGLDAKEAATAKRDIPIEMLPPDSPLRLEAEKKGYQTVPAEWAQAFSRAETSGARAAGQKRMLRGQEVKFGQLKVNPVELPDGRKIVYDLDLDNAPTQQEAVKFRNQQKSIGNMMNALARIEEIIKKRGGDINSYTGEDYTKLRAELGNLSFYIKDSREAGANYTALEMKRFEGILPKILENPNVTVWDALVEVGLDRNPMVALDQMKKILTSELTQSAKAYKYEMSFEGPDSGVATPAGNPGSTLSPEARQRLMDLIRKKLEAPQGIQ